MEIVDDKLLVDKFLNGDVSKQLKEMKQKMEQASVDLEFEKAIEYRELITHIKKTVEKQQISINDFTDRDIFGFFVKDNLMTLSVFYLRKGKIVARDIDTVELFEDANEAFMNYILERIMRTGDFRSSE